MIQLVIQCSNCDAELLVPSTMTAKKGGDVKTTVRSTVLTNVCKTCGQRPFQNGLDVTIRHVPK